MLTEKEIEKTKEKIVRYGTEFERIKKEVCEKRKKMILGVTMINGCAVVIIKP